MFKIVQTLEKGCLQLTIVPQAWENGGQLAWPRTRADKLVRTAHSMPDKTWFFMKCKLKRNHLISYGVAEEELERMLEKEDTEQEEPAIDENKKRSRVFFSKRRDYQDNFNEMAQTCVVPPKIVEMSSASSINGKTTTQENSSVIFEIENEHLLAKENLNVSDQGSYLIVNNPASNIDTPIELSLVDQLSEKFDTILENQGTIVQNQSLIVQKLKDNATSENQLSIIQQLAKLEAMFEVVINNFGSSHTCSCTRKSNPLETTNNAASFNQIDCLEDLIKFEEQLNEDKVMQDLIQSFSYICGSTGRGNGINNSYILVDRIFTRKFMTMCSWAGGSRDQKEKIPFKIYKRTINLFFKTIHLSDKDFTVKDCEDFFKNVIRNSTRRNESSMIRSSRIKRRPKNLCYKIQSGQVYDKDCRAEAQEVEDEGVGEEDEEVGEKTQVNIAADDKFEEDCM